MTHEERRRLMELFGSLVDNVLQDDRMRSNCCHKWGGFYDQPNIGDGMVAYAKEYVHGYSDLITSLEKWPNEQLRFLTGALLQVIGCPRQPPPLPLPKPPLPEPLVPKPPLPDPLIRPTFEARYGETHGITISLRSPNLMHIVFERHDFEEEPKEDETKTDEPRPPSQEE